jgi:hypothetical protein
LQELDEFRISLVSYYTEYPDDSTSAENKYDNHLIKKFIDCSTHNSQTNGMRSYRLYATTRLIILSLALTFASYVFLLSGGFGTPSDQQITVNVKIERGAAYEEHNPKTGAAAEAKPSNSTARQDN